ncbi:MAG: diadenylate cyclase CdaA [Xenococcaceae cyanobacterium]
MPSSGSVPDHSWILSWLIDNRINIIDIGLVLALTYVVLLIIGERRTLWIVRGLIVLVLAAVVSKQLELILLNFVLEKLVLGSAVAMAVIFQSEFRRFLEQLGQGKISQLFQASRRPIAKPDSLIDEIVNAVKELSQNRTGALMVLETISPIDERDFSDPGVPLNAEISKELLQTIFQTKTLLHDGAVFIRGSRIISAGVILPLSERKAPRQLGTRHRVAMEMTERVNCLCIVVSEETGSISLAEKGNLNRPLTSSKLKELLEARFSPSVDREAVAPGLGRLSRTIGFQGRILLERVFRLPSSTSKEKK